MKNNIFIPKKCKVGFNEREDTYTGLLGYIIMYDGKKWRKEPSWENWRQKYLTPEKAEEERIKEYNKKIENIVYHALKNNGKERFFNHSAGKWETLENIKSKEDVIEQIPLETFEWTPRGYSSDEKIKPIEFENEPLEGFVLNKKSGGDRYGWNPRQTYCRVYDPRGFEFEITIQNLLYILENTSSIKGKGLEGKFIYGWAGKDLILVPENSPEFENMVKYTKLQDGKVYKKDLIRGNFYLNSKGEKLTYMGDAREIEWRGLPSKKKKLWFRIDEAKYNWNKFIAYSSVQPIKADLKESNPNFANLMDELEKVESYYPFDLEYIKIDNPGTKLQKLTNYYKNNTRRSLFIKRENDFIQIRINKSYRGGIYGINEKQAYITNIDNYRYESLKEISNKYELWELKTTN